MTRTFDFRPRLRLAARAITEHGWTTNMERDSAGRMCLTGAIRYCAPEDGDDIIIREVLRMRDRAEYWNDRDAGSAEVVINYLRHADITDDDLRSTFGPQALEMIALIRAMVAATDVQRKALNRGMTDSDGLAWDFARKAAVSAHRRATWDAATSAAWTAARRASNWLAPEGPLIALHSRDLIGVQFDWNDYDILTRPWRTAIGRIHPDDPDLMEGGNNV